MQAKGEVVVDDKGEIISMIGTGQDITEQYRYQQQLLDKTKELETANIELQKFAYIASHDLQEPLRKILTFASLLQRESGEDLPEKSKSYIDKMVSSSTRMQRLIEDILNFSRVKNSQEAFEKTSLNKVLEQVLVDLEVTIEDNNAKIKMDELPEVEVIPSQMGQLFQNLISNAIKFRKDEIPVVEITAQKITGYQLAAMKPFEKYVRSLSVSHRMWGKGFFIMLKVKDNGAGFDPVYSEKIFEIFQRLHSNKQQEGTGIGLAICKKILDNHHGAITVQSTLGVGTEFVMALPLSQKDFLQ
jgi:light-regulated signal transduction histidine kinase (bacteriophytochrome)